MLTNDRKQIILMNPVRIDYGLNKFKKADEVKKSDGFDSGAWDAQNAVGVSGRSMVSGSSDWGSDSSIDSNMWDGVPFSVQRRFRSKGMRTIVSLYIKFRLLFDKPTKDPVEIFSEVKDNFKSLSESDMTTADMLDMLKQLERAKQATAIRQVKAKQDVINLEEKLRTAGIDQYQTEASLIQFIVKCKKGLCLTELEAFDRVIPSEVIDKIQKAEELKIFDNYYILHYDPTGAKNIHYTAEPKDPIIFGVIRESNKLYYIADWIDQYCNLTYKDILEKGKDFKLAATSK